MINKLLYILFGSVSFSVSKADNDEAANSLFENKIRYGEVKIDGEGRFVFTAFLITASKVRKLFKERGISYSESTIKGLPKLLLKYGKRIGLIIGVIIFTALVTVSQNYVWYMDVKGCENVTPDSVLENLEQLGFTYGTNFKKVDFDYLRNTYLMTFEDLCWISINMQGTYAHVEVRELIKPPVKVTEGSANIIAAEKGKIVLVESHEGAPVVFPGDRVSKGELLISGIMTSGEDRLRYERAEGSVLAEVERYFKVEISKNKVEKEYSGHEISEYKLNFFKKSVKLSGKCRISHSEYDTIINKVQIDLFDKVYLPIFVEKTTYKPYNVAYTPMTESEIEEKKKKLISDRVSEITSGAQLLEISTCEYETAEKFIVIGTVRCVADIAEQVEVQISQ